MPLQGMGRLYKISNNKKFVEIADRKPGEVFSAPTAFSINPF